MFDRMSPPAAPLPDPHPDLPPELKRFLRRLPASMARRLTHEELAAYAKAMAPQRSPGWLDYKANIPLLGLGIYFGVSAKRKRRGDRSYHERLSHDRWLRRRPYIVTATILLATPLIAWLAVYVLLEGLKLMVVDGREAWWHTSTKPY